MTDWVVVRVFPKDAASTRHRTITYGPLPSHKKAKHLAINLLSETPDHRIFAAKLEPIPEDWVSDL